MQLNVREAKSEEMEFAWPLYQGFVRENLFNGGPNRASPHSWDNAREASRFSEYWSETQPYMIEIDDEVVGWLSTFKTSETITIENVFVVQGWQDKGIVSRFFKEMTPEWRKQGLRIDVPLLKNAPASHDLADMLRSLGFRPAESHALMEGNEITHVMQAQ